jgi:hypothetical protein
MLSLAQQGGWVKHEVEATHGVAVDAEIARGVGWGAGAACGTVVGAEATRGTGWGARPGP